MSNFKEDSLKKPVNTTSEVQANPMGMLMMAAVMGTGDAIEHQEATGQSDFVGSDTLPNEMSAQDRAALEKFGVKFIGPVEGDTLFQYVKLPDGWHKIPSGHSMWTELVDEQGRKRAAIFYKAAFYDRSAHLTVNRRYATTRNWEAQDSEGAIVSVKDTATDKLLFSATPIYKGADIRKFYSESEVTEKKARQWLDDNFPKWQDAAEYWGA